MMRRYGQGAAFQNYTRSTDRPSEVRTDDVTLPYVLYFLSSSSNEDDFAMLKELAKKMQSDSLLHPAAQRARDLIFSVEVMVKKEERQERIEKMKNMRPSRMPHYYPKIDK